MSCVDLEVILMAHMIGYAVATIATIAAFLAAVAWSVRSGQK